MRPILQRAKDDLMLKAAARSPFTKKAVKDTHHRELVATWISAGNFRNYTAQGYFVIRYCPECMYGTVIDLVFEQPKGKNARELSVIKKHNWSSICPIQLKGDE